MENMIKNEVMENEAVVEVKERLVEKAFDKVLEHPVGCAVAGLGTGIAIGVAASCEPVKKIATAPIRGAKNLIGKIKNKKETETTEEETTEK